MLKIDKTHTFIWVVRSVVWVYLNQHSAVNFLDDSTDTDCLIAIYTGRRRQINEITMHGTAILLLSYRVVVINIIPSTVPLFIFGHTVYCQSKPMMRTSCPPICVYDRIDLYVMCVGWLCIQCRTTTICGKAQETSFRALTNWAANIQNVYMDCITVP